MRILIAIILFSFTCQGQVVKASKNYIPFAVTSCTPDADAQAYIDSAGITNQSEKDAVCNFVTQLKNYSLWDKIIAAYPLAGTTSTSQKWNLKDGNYPLKDQLYGSTATLKVENGVGVVKVSIGTSESFVFKI